MTEEPRRPSWRWCTSKRRHRSIRTPSRPSWPGDQHLPQTAMSAEFTLAPDHRVRSGGGWRCPHGFVGILSFAACTPPVDLQRRVQKRARKALRRRSASRSRPRSKPK